jgi:MFS family permease
MRQAVVVYVRPLPDRVSSQVLFLLCLIYLILYIDRVNISTAAPLIQHDLALSNTQLGFAFSAFAYPYAVFQLIGGWLADRYGPRWTLGVSGFVVCAATALTGLVGGLGTLVAARFALGCGEGNTFPTATRAMAAWVPASRWGFAQGVTHSAARIGNALTPPLIASLVAFATWRGSFALLGAANLLWVAVWSWFFRDDPRSHPRVRASEAETLAARPAGEPPAAVPRRLLVWRMMPVTVVDFCYGWTLWVFLSWVPSFFFQHFHLNLNASALFSAGVFLSGVAGDALGGVVSDRILAKTGNLRLARTAVIAAGLFGAFVFLVPIAAVHSLRVVTLCLSAAFFCTELAVAPIWSVPMDIAPRHAGSAAGMMNFGFGCAGIISPVVFGYVIDVTGSWTVPFLSSAALLLVGGALALCLRPDRYATGSEPLRPRASA